MPTKLIISCCVFFSGVIVYSEMLSKGKAGDRPPSSGWVSVPEAESSTISPGNISYHNHTEEHAITVLEWEMFSYDNLIWKISQFHGIAVWKTQTGCWKLKETFALRSWCKIRFACHCARLHNTSESKSNQQNSKKKKKNISKTNILRMSFFIKSRTSFISLLVKICVNVCTRKTKLGSVLYRVSKRFGKADFLGTLCLCWSHVKCTQNSSAQPEYRNGGYFDSLLCQ